MKVERDGIEYELFQNDGVVEVTMSEKKLGDIFVNPGDWESILNGADPVRDGWEDGNGHPLSEEGWGA